MKKSIAILIIVLAALNSNASDVSNDTIESVINEQNQTHEIILASLNLNKVEVK